jgi:hypothetical protein
LYLIQCHKAVLAQHDANAFAFVVNVGPVDNIVSATFSPTTVGEGSQYNMKLNGIGKQGKFPTKTSGEEVDVTTQIKALVTAGAESVSVEGAIHPVATYLPEVAWDDTVLKFCLREHSADKQKVSKCMG